jgi:hypothetical protein
MAECISLVFNRVDLSEEEKMANVFIQAAKDFFYHIPGKIYAVPSIRKGRDMDLIVWMHFNNYKPSIKTGYISNPNQMGEKVNSLRKNRDIWFNSSLLVIELKKHNNQDSISIRNGSLYLKYGSEFKNASDQSFNQIFHLQNYLADRLCVPSSKVPIIQNLIWLNRCAEKPAEYDDLGNVIYGEINFSELLKQLCTLKKPISFDNGINISYSACNPDIYHKMDAFFDFLGKEKANGLGVITRNKLDRIINDQLNLRNDRKIQEIGEKFLMIKGKPGTGKTIYLVLIAAYLIEQEYKPIILTYNKALVLDIKRMLTYQGHLNSLEIRTIHSFFLNILKEFEIGDIAENGFEDYERGLHQLFEVIKDFTGEEVRKVSKMSHDILLIDEAQDCLEIEKNLFLIIFKKQNIVASIGDRQIVRENALKWTDSIQRKNLNLITLAVSYRNKKDLVDLFNTFSLKHFEQAPWDLKENQSLTGGRLQIIDTALYDKDFHFQLINELISKDNSMYDLMFLTPNITKGINHADKLSNLLDEWNLKAYNNTLKENITEFPIDEHRILNYHSCRGLEAWILVCWNLDIIIQNIKNSFYNQGVDAKEVNLHLNNWLLIIFTRAIDTLILTFENKESEEAKLIISIAQSKAFNHMTVL